MAARASSTKKTGGNWLPVAKAAEQSLVDTRSLYKTVLRMRELSYDLSTTGKWVTPAPSEWDCLLDEVQRVAEGLRLGLKGR